MRQLQHELRQVKDGIEREGGVGYGLEQRVAQLEDDIKLCDNELKQNLKQQVGASKRLKNLHQAKNKNW